MKNILFIGIIAFMLICFQSCKESDEVVTNSSETLENYLKAGVSEIVSSSVNESSIQDIHGICIEKYDGHGEALLLDGNWHGIGHFKIPHLSDCATITVSDSLYPKEIIIDYGSVCINHRKDTISGKIVIYISDTLRKSGSEKTVVFQDFYIDSVKVELTATFKNLGINPDSNWVMVSTTDQTIVFGDGTIISMTSQDTTEWLSGFETITKKDDIFQKSGSGSIVINDSLVYSLKITSPLVYDRSCKYIISGIVELYKDGNYVIIDYGDDTCDDVATMTVNGTTEEINLQNYTFDKHGKFHNHYHGLGKHKVHGGNGSNGE